MSKLAESVSQATKDAMRAKDSAKLATLRLLQAAFKQVVIDNGLEELTDVSAMMVIEKLLKQRREAITTYQDAGRTDLAEKEQAEAALLSSFLPEPLSDVEVSTIVTGTITELGVNNMRDMGKLMEALRPKLQGRADMAKVSALVKTTLASQSS
jgi:uncharacterized protein YqeY